jgi:predicted permease
MTSDNIPPPPRLAKRLLGFMKGYLDNYSIIDDLDAVYKSLLEEYGHSKAASWYWHQTLGAIPKYLAFLLTWKLVMFGSYFKIALRNIKRNKVFSFINIGGLAVGMAVCILIFLIVQYELGFDEHVPDKDHIYRVVTEINRADWIDHTGGTPFPTAAALRSDFPELEQTTQIYRDDEMMITVGENRYKGDILFFVEPQFFEVFDTEWVQGNASQALDDPFTVILTERVADKYFGNTKAIGKVLKLNNEHDLRVVGVVSNPPRRTSLPYDMLISWKSLSVRWTEERLAQWDFLNDDSQAFTLLPEAVKSQTLEERFEQFERKYMEPEYAESWSFRLQPLSDIHFNPRYESYNYVTSRVALLSLSAIGLLILVIACINFINLTTAQAIKKNREIGMRKVLGAGRVQLIRQLLGETSWFTLISILIALFLAWSALPYLEQFLGNNTDLRIFSGSGIFLFLGIVFLLVSGLNGLYPAFSLSRYRPIEALRERSAHRGKRSLAFRNILVLVQFIIAQVLIVGTLVIAGQMKFMSGRDLGFRKEQIVTVPIPAYEEARCEALRSRWMQNPSIREVSFAWSAPVSSSHFRTPFEYDASGPTVEFPVNIKICDKRYLDIYQIPLVAGRFFARNTNDESDAQWVVTASVARRMGLPDPQEAVGQQITVNGIKGEIIGVIDDFNAFSLHTEIEPTVFLNFWPMNFRQAQILLDTSRVPAAISHIKKAWTELYPEYIFQYEFLDDYIKSLYETESKLMVMIQSASFLSILIGCLGLLGLVSFLVLQRSKEIGIRKVLGATVTGVYFMISREFFKWIVIANIVAWPLAYYLTHEWLQEFAYRIPLGAGYFLIGGFISLGVSALVMSYQVMRAATANPVDCLRYE